MQRSKFSLMTCCLLLLTLTFVVGSATAATSLSWDKRIDNPKKRFKVLSSFDDEAVLDKETQLVWHRFPDTSGSFTWGQALSGCWGSQFGGRLGWRLATIVELHSLIDRSQLPALPAGHPFVFNPPASDVWSSTTTPGNPVTAVTIDINSGFLGGVQKDGVTKLWRWCVRGGSGIEGQ